MCPQQSAENLERQAQIIKDQIRQTNDLITGMEQFQERFALLDFSVGLAEKSLKLLFDVYFDKPGLLDLTLEIMGVELDAWTSLSLTETRNLTSEAMQSLIATKEDQVNELAEVFFKMNNPAHCTQ